MIDYAQSLGTYWIRIIEQLVPATTLWQGGLKVENSVFHRDKFTYKHYPVFPLSGFNNPQKPNYVGGCTDSCQNLFGGNIDSCVTTYPDSCQKIVDCVQGRFTALPTCADGKVHAGGNGTCLSLCDDEHPCTEGTCHPWQGTGVCW